MSHQIYTPFSLIYERFPEGIYIVGAWVLEHDLVIYVLASSSMTMAATSITTASIESPTFS